MNTAHLGMNKNESEYLNVMEDIFIVLDKHEIDSQIQKDVLSIIWPLKGSIISQ